MQVTRPRTQAMQLPACRSRDPACLSCDPGTGKRLSANHVANSVPRPGIADVWLPYTHHYLPPVTYEIMPHPIWKREGGREGEISHCQNRCLPIASRSAQAGWQKRANIMCCYSARVLTPAAAQAPQALTLFNWVKRH